MPCYKQSHSVFIHKFNTSDFIDSYEMHGILALPCGQETIEEHPYSEGDYLEERMGHLTRLMGNVIKSRGSSRKSTYCV